MSDGSPSALRRLAAGTTLILLALFTAVAFALVFVNLPELFVSWIGMAVTIIAFSRTLGSSSAGRIVWRIVMAAGVVVAVGALAMLTISSPWALATALVALGGMAIFGTYALAPQQHTTVRLAADRPVLFVNPKSGGGRATKASLVEIARNRGIEVHVLGPRDDLTEMARTAIADGADAVGAAGGDGSLGYVAAAAIEASIPFICIPAGTRNHFARDLGLDRSDVVGALDAFEGEIRMIDYATLNGRVYLNVASMGVYAKTVSDPGYRDAKLETARETLKALQESGEHFDLRFSDNDGRRHESADLIMVSSGRYKISGALFDIGKRPDLATGQLGVIVLEISQAADAIELATLSAAGLIDRYHGWSQWETSTFSVDSGSQVAVGMDGESVMVDPPLRFEIHPGEFTVAVPRGTPFGPRVSPLGTTGSIASLWRTLVGQEPS